MLFNRVRRSRALTQAEEALSKGQLVEARQIAEDVLAEDPDTGRALHVLGQVLLDQGDLDAARDVFERCTNADQGDEQAREQLGQVHIRLAVEARELGELDAAITHSQNALDLVQDCAHVYYNMGCAYADFHEQHAAEAVEMWRRAIEERPDYVEAHFDLGTALFHSDRFDEAQEHFQAIVERREDWPAPLYLLGVIHVKKGNTERALECLKSAILVNTSWARTASEDDHLSPLRGNEVFEELIQVQSLLSAEDLSRNVLTPEEIFADVDEDPEDP